MSKFSCSKCDISLYCKNQVWGNGHPDADIMIVGENPGYQEDKQGLPFVGSSGKELDIYLKLCNFQREYIYITNAVKCKTPKNYTPSELEIDHCRHYLIKEIESVNPKILIILGNTAFTSLFLREPNRNRPQSIALKDIIGKWFRWRGIWCITLYHPAYILRDITRRPDYFAIFKDIVDKYREFNSLHSVNY